MAIYYGSYFYEKFSGHINLSRAADSIRGVRDVEYFRRSNNFLANGALEHCIVLWGCAFLMLVVLVMHIVKMNRIKRLQVKPEVNLPKLNESA